MARGKCTSALGFIFTCIRLTFGIRATYGLCLAIHWKFIFQFIIIIMVLFSSYRGFTFFVLGKNNYLWPAVVPTDMCDLLLNKHIGDLNPRPST